jgi:hypothetical protein
MRSELYDYVVYYVTKIFVFYSVTDDINTSLHQYREFQYQSNVHTVEISPHNQVDSSVV